MCGIRTVQNLILPLSTIFFLIASDLGNSLSSVLLSSGLSHLSPGPWLYLTISQLERRSEYSQSQKFFCTFRLWRQKKLNLSFYRFGIDSKIVCFKMDKVKLEDLKCGRNICRNIRNSQYRRPIGDKIEYISALQVCCSVSKI